ncbi:MAG: copper chaperone CopZ [Clostridiales bacterium]
MKKVIKEFNVEGMSCNHCKNAVKKCISELEGVESVDVELDLKKVTVKFDEDKVDQKKIIEEIEDQGYDAKG